VIIIGAVLLGLIVGSFLNVVIYRLPLMMDREWRQQARQLLGQPGEAETTQAPINLISPRSHCPACQAPVAARHNVPVLSYLLLKGRCAACGTAISPRYPLIELLTALLSATMIWHFGPTLAGLAALVLGWALIAASAIDLDHQLLPDSITQPLLWLGLALGLSGVLTDTPPFPDLQSAVLGAMAGYLSLWTVYKVFKWLTGKEGMGYGDFKLLAALGAWLGWQMLPLVIILSAVVGTVTGIAMIAIGRHSRQAPIPFGPFLAAAGLCALLWGPELVTVYLGMRGV
jgi:leader peptidase (prepilin peptidase)/N-methyltransferase